jgi:hypothetical protein
MVKGKADPVAIFRPLEMIKKVHSHEKGAEEIEKKFEKKAKPLMREVRRRRGTGVEEPLFCPIQKCMWGSYSGSCFSLQAASRQRRMLLTGSKTYLANTGDCRCPLSSHPSLRPCRMRLPT